MECLLNFLVGHHASVYIWSEADMNKTISVAFSLLLTVSPFGNHALVLLVIDDLFGYSEIG